MRGTWIRGITSMCPGADGNRSRNATACSLEYTQHDGSVSTVEQNGHVLAVGMVRLVRRLATRTSKVSPVDRPG